jgi:ATP-dependent metalloprotease
LLRSCTDVAGRAAILSSYLGAVIAESKLDPILVARGTPGFSGADLENLVNQAAVYASKMGAKAIGLSHLEWAKDR